MSRAVTLTTMIARVRRRASIQNATAAYPDADITDDLNESLAELYDLMVSVHGQEYFRNIAVFSTASGVATYPLPSDFYQLISVDINVGGSVVLTAKPFMENERNFFKIIPGWYVNTPVFYRLQGTGLTLIPQPAGAYTVDLNYIPAPTKLVLGSDTFDGVAGWEEYAVLDTAIKILNAEETDTSALEGRKAAIKDRILGMAANRANAPERVTDVTATDDWWL